MNDERTNSDRPGQAGGAREQAGRGHAPAAEPPAEPPAESPAKRSPVQRMTRTVLAVILVVFVWYLFADRYAPYTNQARTRTLAIPVVPRVSGYLTEVNVRLHSVVSQNDLLFQIDRTPYEQAVAKAEAALDNVSQQVGAMTATVKAAAGRLGVAKAQLDRAQRNYDRTQKVLAKNPGALSQADLDQTETALAQALERVSSAEADLEKAKQQLGTSGPENAQVREAIVALEQAHYDLASTSLYAPMKGAIESFNLDIGSYAQAGSPLVTFVPQGDVWIQADYRENNLGHIDIGDRAEFSLDVVPGRVFGGRVRSIGYGVSSGENNNGGSLPKITSSQGWLRDPQRFPVVIEIDQDDIETIGTIRSGGQASVIVYASRNPLLNVIGWLQVRIGSLLSYVR